MKKLHEQYSFKVFIAFALAMVPCLAFADDASKVYEMIRLARTTIYVIDGLVCTVAISWISILWKFGRKDIGDFVQVVAISVAAGAAVALINWGWSAYATSSLTT